MLKVKKNLALLGHLSPLTALNQFVLLVYMFSPDIGTRYDLDFQSPQKSGQNFKSADDMIELYKELCSGKSVYHTVFLMMILQIIWAILHVHFGTSFLNL